MQIIFNGKTYDSLEEMPANDRLAYEGMFQIFKDENGNGIPDFLEGDIAKNVMAAAFGSNIVHYDGKVFNNLDELPPEARQKVQEAFAKLNQMGILTAASFVQLSGGNAPDFEPAFQPSKPLLGQEPATQESGGTNWMIIVGFLAALLLCAVAFALITFLR